MFSTSATAITRRIRRVTLGQRVRHRLGGHSGLANGEIVIVSGIQKIQPGIVVTPVPRRGTEPCSPNLHPAARGWRW